MYFFTKTENQMLKNEKAANHNEHQNRKTDLRNSQNRKTENPNVPLIVYRKIPKISPGTLIFFKGPFRGAYFWKCLYSEGLIYGGKFAFPKRLG